MNNPESSREMAAAEAAQETTEEIKNEDITYLADAAKKPGQWADELIEKVEASRSVVPGTKPKDVYIELPSDVLEDVEIKPIAIPDADVEEVTGERHEEAAWVDELIQKAKADKLTASFTRPAKPEQQGPVREWVDELTNQVEAAKNADPKIEVELVDADDETEEAVEKAA